MEPLLVFLSNLVLFLTLATLVFAVGACIAMVLSRRKPARERREPIQDEATPILRRYIPPDAD